MRYDSDRSHGVTVSRGRTAFERLERATDLPLAFLALLIVPALIIEDRSSSVALRHAATAINWIVWLAFCAEYAGKCVLAPDRRAFVRDAWFDLVIIVLSPPFLVPAALQGARAIRILRLLRFVRAVAVAAIGLREAAQGLRHRHFHYVATTEGRLIAVMLMIVGIGFIGIFTATITSFFVLPAQKRSDFEERLIRIEAKLDALTTEREQSVSPLERV